MTITTTRIKERVERVSGDVAFVSNAGTPSEAAAKLFASVGPLAVSTPLSSGPSGPRARVRNSILGLTAVSTILVGAIAPSVAAEGTTAYSLVRRQNQVRENSWWEVLGAESGIANSSSTPTPPAAVAADQLKEWLSLNDSELADLCGFSRRSLLNWRNGGGVYGASSRRLFAIHALIGHIAVRLGSERAMLWLNAGDIVGVSRLQALADGEDGIRRVLSQAEPIIFPEFAKRANFESGVSDAEAASVMVEASRAEVSSSSPVRRARKPLTDG